MLLQCITFQHSTVIFTTNKEQNDLYNSDHIIYKKWFCSGSLTFNAKHHTFIMHYIINCNVYTVQIMLSLPKIIFGTVYLSIKILKLFKILILLIYIDWQTPKWFLVWTTFMLTFSIFLHMTKCYSTLVYHCPLINFTLKIDLYQENNSNIIYNIFIVL